VIHNLKHDFINLLTATTTLLQFADDTIVITPAHPKNLKLLIQTFQTFANVSGLHINLNKSGFLPIAIPDNLTTVITNILKCETLTTPIQYLRLPLTIKKKPPKSSSPVDNKCPKKIRRMERQTPFNGRTINSNKLGTQCGPSTLHANPTIAQIAHPKDYNDHEEIIMEGYQRRILGWALSRGMAENDTIKRTRWLGNH
jgi:Reverse transcriptase (RNA-dependent DNA polymerase)